MAYKADQNNRQGHKEVLVPVVAEAETTKGDQNSLAATKGKEVLAEEGNNDLGKYYAT